MLHKTPHLRKTKGNGKIQIALVNSGWKIIQKT